MALPLLGLGCTLALVLACFWPVLFRDGQFVHFDSSFFYYPLYYRVQQEWAAGRWPLWDPGQNGGTPLLGNPVAAVLYPGKLVFGPVSYAWGMRLYVIAHVLVALLGMIALARSLGVSGVGSVLAGLTYAFGAPVLLQYGNLIFLVGAAWVPWGLRAIDRLLRKRRRLAIAELAVIMALQVLGGDPEAAYLTVICGLAYSLLLVLEERAWRWPRRLPVWLIVPGVLVLWAGATLGLAWVRPEITPAWRPAVRWLVIGAWVAAGIAILWSWQRRRSDARLGPLLAGIAGACILAACLSAVQLVPVLEFSGRSVRVTGDSALDVYRFSLVPLRFVEMVWPKVFGIAAPENHSWIKAVLPLGDREPWVLSLYMGGLGLVLALSAAGMRGVPAWRAWLTWVALVAMAASLGRFGGPLWWARWTPWAAGLGPHDPVFPLQRGDVFFEDGTASPYAILATLLPGFSVFRFPIKLWVFSAVSIAALSGAGWDRLVSGEVVRTRRLCWIGLGASVLGLVPALIAGGRIVAYLTGRVDPDAMYGPSDIPAAWAMTQRALAQAALVFGAGLVLIRLAPRNPRLAGCVALLVVTADLALAGSGLVWTAPQSAFETPPEVARLIEAAERADPSPRPFRIHRTENWLPAHDYLTRSPGRLGETVAWERGTLQPLYGLPLGFEYCATYGIMELDAYNAYLQSAMLPAPADLAQALGLPPDRPVRYFLRAGYDLWGARYFILPTVPQDWDTKARGIAAFLPDTELIYPEAETLRGEHDRPGEAPWGVRQDWQLRRNRAAFPRAWLVHYARVRPPSADLAGLLWGLLFMNDPLWSRPDHPVLDLHSAAWIETDDPARLKGFVADLPVEPDESVTVLRHDPQRVELRAILKRPGLVILADTFDPGWRLSIDGRPAPIFRANGVMRGAAVSAGEHRLIYTYEPLSFRIGAIVSAVGLVALLILVAFTWRDPRAMDQSS